MDILVAPQGELVVGQHGGAAGAVGQDVMALVEEALVPEGLHDPPDGFHVIAVHGFVVPLKVHPAAQAGDDLLPFPDVAQHRGPAGFVELRDSEALDVRLGVEAQLPFDEVFHRQAVAVPAKTALHLFALHGLVAGDDVLDDAGHKMAEMGHPRGKGGAVVEDVFFGRLRTFPPGYGLPENIVFLPEGQNVLFQPGEIYLWINRLIHLLLHDSVWHSG